MADPFLLSALRFLELGEGLRRQGRLTEAKGAYEAALASDPASGPAWLGLGLAAEALGDTQAAQNAFARAADLDPASLGAQLGLASACRELEQPLTAAAAWLKAHALKPDDFRIHNLVWQALNEIEAEGTGYAGLIAQGNRLRHSGRNEAALAAYRQAQELEPGLPFAFSRAGCLLAKSGDLAAAEAQFAQARRLADWVESGIRLAPSFFKALPDYCHHLGWLQQAPGAGPVVVVGCDGVYFKRYAAPFKQSLDRFEGATAGLHVHLAHPDAECLEQARAMGVGVSFENPGMAGHSRNFINTYYASARFLALPELLKAYDRPLLVMDVDAKVLQPLAPLWAALQENDMAIRRWQGTMVDPWNEPQANLVGVNPTPMGRSFASSCARFLAYFLARGMLFGFFDQTALYCVLAADPSLRSLKKGAFPANAYGYPLNRGAAPGDLVYPPELLVGEFKTPSP